MIKVTNIISYAKEISANYEIICRTLVCHWGTCSPGSGKAQHHRRLRRGHGLWRPKVTSTEELSLQNHWPNPCRCILLRRINEVNSIRATLLEKIMSNFLFLLTFRG